MNISKATLVVLSILNVTGLLAILGYLLLKGLGESWSTSGYPGGPISDNVKLAFVILIVLLSFILLYLDRNRALIWLLLPLFTITVLFLIAHKVNSKARANWNQEIMKIREQKRIKASNITKDYSDKSDKNSHSHDRSLFLHYDKNNNVIVRVYLDSGRLDQVEPFGIVKDDTIETYEDLSSALAKAYNDHPSVLIGDYYKELTDAQGKSVFDKYKVIYRANQDLADYHLDQYK